MIHIQQMHHVYNATVNALASFDAMFHSDTMHPILFSPQYSAARKNFESRCTLGKDMELFEQFLYLPGAGSGWRCLFISSREGERAVQEFLLHGTELKAYVSEQQSQAKYGKV